MFESFWKRIWKVRWVISVVWEEYKLRGIYYYIIIISNYECMLSYIKMIYFVLFK